MSTVSTFDSWAYYESVSRVLKRLEDDWTYMAQSRAFSNYWAYQERLLLAGFPVTPNQRRRNFCPISAYFAWKVSPVVAGWNRLRLFHRPEYTTKLLHDGVEVQA